LEAVGQQRRDTIRPLCEEIGRKAAYQQ